MGFRGDIKSCFDKISHDLLLAHIPMEIRVILQKWLKSGYMEKHVLHEMTEGTPQGGPNHAPYTKGNFQFERTVVGWRERYTLDLRRR